jgi:hypothetical protein
LAIISFALLTAVMGMNWPQPLDDWQEDSFEGRQLYLGMTLVNADPIANKATFSCWIYDDTCAAVDFTNWTSYSTIPEDAMKNCTPVNVYVDTCVPSIATPSG